MSTDIKRNIAAALVGFISALVLVVIVDSVFGWANNIKVSKSQLFPKADDVDGLGWSVRNQGKLRSTKTGYSLEHRETFNGQPIFDVTYNFDKHFRRKVPASPQADVDRFVLFFGGSQTFGEGLKDSDTIPARVQVSAPNHSVYNYAYKGYGPHQMLKKLQTSTLASEVGEQEGIAFYQYFGFHLQRVVGTLSYIGWAGGGAPHYRLGDDQAPEYSGSFASGRFGTTFVYWLLSRSAIAQHFKVDLPGKMSSAHHALLCSVVDASRESFLQQYPGSRFIVIVSITNGMQDQIVQNCLEPNAIEYVDIRGLEAGKDNLTFPHNGHFTGKGARLIAEQLSALLTVQ